MPPPDEATRTAIVDLRHRLHRLAEVADGEEGTARAVARFLGAHNPDRLIAGIGGHGLAAVFGTDESGPCIAVRAELDALPIPETIALEHASVHEGVAHKCGHDGHMAMVAGLAPGLAARPPKGGRVVLVFQPAEERGEGAARMLADPALLDLGPTVALALHNLPGHPLGQVVVADGVFAAASRGLCIELEGATSHAAEPERGRSPALATAELIAGLSAAPQFATSLHQAAQVTIIHAQVGEPSAFGTSPGRAVVMATLRTFDEDVMTALAGHCAELAQRIGAAHGLRTQVEWMEEFPTTVNDPLVSAAVERAARDLGLDVIRRQLPFAWSEDFGHFCARMPGTLFGLGAGLDQAALHHPDYDFPDALLPQGIALFRAVVDDLITGQPEAREAD